MADYSRMKRAAWKLYRQGKWELSLRTIFFAAGFMYTMNQILCDRELENLIGKIADQHLPSAANPTLTDNIVVYYDGFGLIGRGLTYIYLKALVHLGYQVKYITFESNRRIHDSASEMVGEENVFYISGTTLLEQMAELQRFLTHSRAGAAFLYMNPDDVVAVGSFAHCPVGMKRYLINLTDHAFWLGIGIADEIINFREFGHKVCAEKRGVCPTRLQYLPYYPGELKAEWSGLPFHGKQDKLIFSGGTLYKTESRDNGYYRLVEAILDTYAHVNFMYLGNGDTRRIRRLRNKYPERVAYAAERKDFFEIMKRCTLYLSTYPYNGGLMTQYALLAGKVPVTLNHPGIEAELSIRHEESFWNYSTQEECLREIGKLLEDKDYRHRKEQDLGKFLIDETQFEQELQCILRTGRSMRIAGDSAVAFDGFWKLPLENIRGLDYYRLFFRRKGWYMIRFFPWKYCLGMLKAFLQKIQIFD